MKPVLILEHYISERAAYLKTWLEQHNIDYKIVNIDIDKEYPTSIEPYSALAVMGGAMSANDPLLSNKQAEILILQSMYRDIPVIGHCLGGQLMSKALGGTISKSPKPEIGWQPITFNDPNWFGNDPVEKVIHWHYETFSIPTGATVVASSDTCPNQAFSIGKHLAMQFHIEIDEPKIDLWVNEEDDNWATVYKQYDTVQNKSEILADIPKLIDKHKLTANSVYSKWLETTGWQEKLINI